MRRGGPRWKRAGTPRRPRRYAQALDLWRGPVLADLADYAFIRPEAARLEELRLAALEARIDADLALGGHDALTAELEQLAGEHPLRERLHGQLMLALYRCGRQADALAAYRRVRDLLADELGIDPGEPLRRLHAAVLAQDPALDWNGRPPGPGRRSPARTPVSAPAPESPRRRRREAGSWPGRGGAPAACWPSARRWRSPQPCASSPWPGRGRASRPACRPTAWA